MVTVFFWNKGQNGRRWNRKRYYHPQCWIEQGLDYLKMNPYTPAKEKQIKGLTEAQRRERFLLLRKKAYLEQKKRKLDSNSPEDMLAILNIEVEITDVALKIAKVGGVPPKWIAQLI